MKKFIPFLLLVAIFSIQVSAFAGTAKHKKRHKSHSRSSASIEGDAICIKAGLNLANCSISGSSETPSILPSFHFGGSYLKEYSDMLSVETGLLVSGKGCSSKVNASQNMGGYYYTIKGTDKVKPIYLEIPVNGILKFPVGDNFFLVYAGGYFGYGIAGKMKTDLTLDTNIPGFTLEQVGFSNSTSNIKFGDSDQDNMRALDFGLNAGIGFQFSTFQVRAQYGLGLKDISTTSGVKVKNNVIGVTFVYMIQK